MLYSTGRFQRPPSDRPTDQTKRGMIPPARAGGKRCFLHALQTRLSHICRFDRRFAYHVHPSIPTTLRGSKCWTDRQSVSRIFIEVQNRPENASSKTPGASRIGGDNIRICLSNTSFAIANFRSRVSQSVKS